MIALVLVGCGSNNVLNMLTSNYAPYRPGSSYTYVKADGSPAYTLVVSDAGLVAGKAALSVLITPPSPAPSVTEIWAISGSRMELLDPVLGWTLQRQLPYITNNTWRVPTSTPNLTSEIVVEAPETVIVPAGSFASCFKIHTKDYLYNPGTGLTSTTQTYVWAAPGVGDVKTVSVDALGISTTDALLASYRLGP